VKVLSDLLTKKQIVKEDANGNVLFRVTGSLGDGFVSSSIPITGSEAFLAKVSVNTNDAFNNIPIVTSSLDTYNIYDVDQAFHAVDTALSNANVTDIQSSYRRLRFAEVGNFDIDGTKIIVLPKTGSSPTELRFPASSIDYVSVNVSIRESGSSSWYNDLVSVETVVSGASSDEIWVVLDAAALDSADSYKLIAVNENPNDYVVS
jgi:hypothetical protein